MAAQLPTRHFVVIELETGIKGCYLGYDERNITHDVNSGIPRLINSDYKPWSPHPEFFDIHETKNPYSGFYFE